MCFKKEKYFENINITPPKCMYKNGFHCWPRKKTCVDVTKVTTCWHYLELRYVQGYWIWRFCDQSFFVKPTWSITKEIEKISYSLNLAQDDKEYKFKMHLDSLENQNLRTMYSHTTLIFSYWHFFVSFLGIIVEPLEPC